MTDYKIERVEEYGVIDPETGVEKEQPVWTITNGVSEWFVPVAEAETEDDAWDWFADHVIY